MDNETAVIEKPPPAAAGPPVKGPTAGDKFKAEFARLEGTTPPPVKEDKPVEKPVEPPPVKPDEKPVDKPTEKPASPLDAAIGKDKPVEVKPAETSDVLKEFDDQKPNWTRAREVMKTQSGRIKE